MLSRFGWSNPAQNTQAIVRSLDRLRAGTTEYDEVLLALMNLRYRPVLPLVTQRIDTCGNYRCRCSRLIARLVYVDPTLSLVYGAEWLCAIGDSESQTGFLCDLSTY